MWNIKIMSELDNAMATLNSTATKMYIKCVKNIAEMWNMSRNFFTFDVNKKQSIFFGIFWERFKYSTLLQSRKIVCLQNIVANTSCAVCCFYLIFCLETWASDSEKWHDKMFSHIFPQNLTWCCRYCLRWFLIFSRDILMENLCICINVKGYKSGALILDFPVVHS